MSDEQLPIHQRYLLLVEHLFIDPPVLKTDLWNELYTPWPIPADIYIEIDKEMVETARKGGMNVSLCSITICNWKMKVSEQYLTSLQLIM